MLNKPLFTVAIPTFNRLEYLKFAVESVLSQTFFDIQLVISDNFSSDGTPVWLQTLNDPRIVLLYQESNLGMVKNWNKCLEAASGDYFLLLSDDDYLDKNFILEIQGFIEKYKDNFSICYGKTVIHSEKNLHNKSKSQPQYENGINFINEFFVGNRTVYPCSLLFRTSDLISGNGFSELFPSASDAYSWMKIIIESKKPVLHCEKAISFYRMHNKSISSTQKKYKWATEILDLLNFVLNKIDISNDTKNDFTQAKFRCLTRKSYYQSTSRLQFYRSYFIHIGKLRPPILEIVQGFIRWSIPENIWQAYKSVLGRVGY